jgi:hypothetical protein
VYFTKSGEDETPKGDYESKLTMSLGPTGEDETEKGA